jgi:hypothetical protein
MNLYAEPQKNAKNAYWPFFLTLLAYFGLSGSFLSLLRWGLSDLRPLLGGVPTLAGLAEGFKLVANRLFLVSEQYQSYRYLMFAINAPESDWALHTAAALGAVNLLFAALCAALACTRRPMAVAVVLAVVTGAQVYFGVSPAPLWNVLLFASLALLGVNKRGAVYAASAVLVCGVVLVAALAGLRYPGPNPALASFSETARDRFAVNAGRLTSADVALHSGGVAEPENRGLNPVNVREETLHGATLHGYRITPNEMPVGTGIGALPPPPPLLPLLLVVMALPLIAFALRYARVFVRLYKRRKGFDTCDCRTAVNDMFLYVLEWLGAYGLVRGNQLFSAYAAPLCGLISREYAREYEQAALLWREAAYSPRPTGEAQRQCMKAFLRKTMGIVWENSGTAAKLKIKFHYFL